MQPLGLLLCLRLADVDAVSRKPSLHTGLRGFTYQLYANLQRNGKQKLRAYGTSILTEFR